MTHIADSGMQFHTLLAKVIMLGWVSTNAQCKWVTSVPIMDRQLVAVPTAYRIDTSRIVQRIVYPFHTLLSTVPLRYGPNAVQYGP